MKALFLALALTSASAFAAPSTFVCTQTGPSSAGGSLSVTVTELRNITKYVPYGRNFDAVWEVQVDVKHRKGSTVLSTQSFKATANAVDVLYTISAVKAHGFRFSMYMDEMDQGGMDVTLNGKKVHVGLNCKLKR